MVTGVTTPGMLTPKELTQSLSPDHEITSKSSGSSNGYDKEKNPFGEFSSVTRDIGDW